MVERGEVENVALVVWGEVDVVLEQKSNELKKMMTCGKTTMYVLQFTAPGSRRPSLS